MIESIKQIIVHEDTLYIDVVTTNGATISANEDIGIHYAKCYDDKKGKHEIMALAVCSAVKLAFDALKEMDE